MAAKHLVVDGTSVALQTTKFFDFDLRMAWAERLALHPPLASALDHEQCHYRHWNHYNNGPQHDNDGLSLQTDDGVYPVLNPGHQHRVAGFTMMGKAGQQGKHLKETF